MFYTDAMAVQYDESPCRSALNKVRGMPFAWSLNPYMGCVHRCTFCYVRAFEARADRPWDDRYGASIRVKTNVAEVVRRELARRSWQREPVAVGAATDPYQPAEGRYRLTRACIETFADAARPFSIITRAPRDRSRTGSRAQARSQSGHPRPPAGAARARFRGRAVANHNYVTADRRSMICRAWRPGKSPASSSTTMRSCAKGSACRSAERRTSA